MANFYTRLLNQKDKYIWPPIRTTKFINLALIEIQKGQQTWHRTVQNSIDVILTHKDKLALYKVIQDQRHWQEFILFEGKSGSGKSTLMKKIIQDWTNGAILMSKLVIYVPFHRLVDEVDHNLTTVIRVACPDMPQNFVDELVSRIERKQGRDVVFVFDGLEDYISQSEHEFVCELLQGKRLTKASIIVTSQPALAERLKICPTKRIEVIGFLKPQILEYIHCIFDDQHKAQQLIVHLEKHPNLMNLAYLPLHCTMLTFMFNKEPVLPEKESDFYKHFVISTLICSIRRRNMLEDTYILSSLDNIPNNDKTTFSVICELAFEATVAQTESLCSSKLSPRIQLGTAEGEETTLGLIVTDRQDTKNGVDTICTFLHRTLQEYLAAVHVARLSESQQVNLIEHYHKKEHLSVVWRYLCGMINTSSCTNNVIMEQTFNGDVLSKIHCCYESQLDDMCTHVMNNLDSQMQFNSCNLTPLDCSAIGYTVKHSGRENVRLIFDECNFSSESVSAFLREIADYPLAVTLTDK